MLYVYLFATIAGGLLLGASLFAGDGHGGGDHDADADGHADSDGHDTGVGSLALQLFSIRVWTYLLAFGGATGLLLRLVARTGEPLAAVLAAGVGVTAGVFARILIKKATAAGAGGTVSDNELTGRSAGVLVPFGKGTTGKIRLQIKGSTVDLLATSEDGYDFAEKDEVLVVEVKDGCAVVTRSPAAQKELP